MKIRFAYYSGDGTRTDSIVGLKCFRHATISGHKSGHSHTQVSSGDHTSCGNGVESAP